MRGRMTVDSDDEGEAASIREDSLLQYPRHLKPRRSEDEDDFDVDVEDECSNLSASLSDEEMVQESDSTHLLPPSNRPQPRQKPSFAKIDKGNAGKKVQQAVIFDDDNDEDDDDSMTWRSDMSADDDPPSSPPQPRATTSSSTRTRNGKPRADFDNMDSFREDRPVTIGTKRPRPLDSEPIIDSKLPSTPVGLGMAVATENKEPVLKKKLPPIKKIKLSDSTASSPLPISKATSTAAKTERPRLTVEGAGLPPPPSSLPRKPAATAGNADLDLSNMDVYKQLFSVSFSIPVSRPRHLPSHQLRREVHLQNLGSRKRRSECESCIKCGTRLGRNGSEGLYVSHSHSVFCLLTNIQVVSFNLAAQNDKIEAFTRRLEARRSPAIWPNTLAAKFKADMQEKIRAEQKAKQQQPQ